MLPRRAEIEARIPDHLLYEKGWPKVMPTYEEAELLCGARREVAALYGMIVSCIEPKDLIARYAGLMAQKAAKEKKLTKVKVMKKLREVV